ncbi:MAG: hypothetical protein IPL96_07840 [Holophagaceae bacterium]|nr:hypothetical protein [Holophagaceae bacterium]
MLTDPWQSLGSVSADALRQARLELHRAVQLAACAGQSLLPKRPDDSQMALTWKDGVLLGEPLPGGARVGLGLADLALEVRDARGGLSGRLPLNGRTQAEALKWVRVRLGGSGVDTSALSAAMPYDLPGHLAAQDAPYSAESSEPLQALSAWYQAAADILAALAAGRADASPLRCWPHHFDLAVLFSLGEGAEPEQARSIGAGLSPGDGSYDEPYFYVTPWPYPEGKTFPDLPLGHWHREGWTGAVLTASELAAAGGQSRDEAMAFLVAAMAGCEGLPR